VNLNKKVYICFVVGIAMLAASPISAAEPAGASSLLPQDSSGAKVSTIRIDRRTGKLVRVVTGGDAQAAPNPRVIPILPPILPAPSAHINELVERSARAHQVDPLLVHSVIQVESNYNPYALSNKGAEGLMQLMPSTSRMLGVANSFDPVENIEAGVRYLKYLQSVYHDDRLALAAYNAGPAAVAKYNEVPPYQETQDYVERVGERYRAAKAAVDRREQQQKREAAQQAEPAAEVPPQELEPILEQSIDSNGRLYLKTVPRTQ
jgi:soluble lytic murein transglycosylase-like protein